MEKEEGKRTQAVLSIAASEKRKIEATEDRNAIAVFSLSDAAGLPETKTFFSAMRKVYLERARKQTRTSECANRNGAAVVKTKEAGGGRDEAEEGSGALIE